MKKLVTLCAIILFLSNCEKDDSKGNIEGRFLDGQELVASAHVSVLDMDGLLRAEGVTNDQGYFLLNNLDVGKYSVLGDFEGNLIQLDNVTVSDKVTTTIILNLKKKLSVKAYMLDGNSFSSTLHCSIHKYDVIMNTTDYPYPSNIQESQVADEYANSVGVAEIWDIEPGRYIFLFWDNTSLDGFMDQYYNGDNTLVISYVF